MSSANVAFSLRNVSFAWRNFPYLNLSFRFPFLSFSFISLCVWAAIYQNKKKPCTPIPKVGTREFLLEGCNIAKSYPVMENQCLEAALAAARYGAKYSVRGWTLLHEAVQRRSADDALILSTFFLVAKKQGTKKGFLKSIRGDSTCAAKNAASCKRTAILRGRSGG